MTDDRFANNEAIQSQYLMQLLPRDSKLIRRSLCSCEFVVALGAVVGIEYLCLFAPASSTRQTLSGLGLFVALSPAEIEAVYSQNRMFLPIQELFIDERLGRIP